MCFIGLTYLHLTAALGITAVSSENPISKSPIVSFLEFIIILALIFAMAAAKPGPYKYVLFALFCILIGQTLAPLVQHLQATGTLREVIGSVAGIFLAMTVVGFLDNQNFLGFGGYLLAALLGLIVARILLIIAKVSDVSSLDVTKMNKALNLIGTMLFAVFVAYDTQLLKRKAKKPYDYVDASLGLFLDIINLFSMEGDM